MGVTEFSGAVFTIPKSESEHCFCSHSRPGPGRIFVCLLLGLPLASDLGVGMRAALMPSMTPSCARFNSLVQEKKKVAQLHVNV